MSTLKSLVPVTGQVKCDPHPNNHSSKQQGAAAAISATSSKCGMHQDKVTGIMMKLNRAPVSGICMATVAFMFTKASCRNQLPVFLAVLRSSMDDVPALLRGCLLGTAI